MWLSLVSSFFGLAYAAGDSSKADPVGDAAGAAADPPHLPFPEFDGKIPTAQQLLEVLDSMTGISEEEKAKLKEDLLRNVQEKASAAQAAGFAGDLTTQTMVLLSLLAIVALIFVFFVYKLFKCLKEREQKRQEKKKNKQLKKKK